MSKQAKFVQSLSPLLTKQIASISPRASPYLHSPALHNTVQSSKKVMASPLVDLNRVSEKQQRNYASSDGLHTPDLKANPDKPKEFDMTDDIRPGRNWHYNIRTNEMEFVNPDDW